MQIINVMYRYRNCIKVLFEPIRSNTEYAI